MAMPSHLDQFLKNPVLVFSLGGRGFRLYLSHNQLHLFQSKRGPEAGVASGDNETSASHRKRLWGQGL